MTDETPREPLKLEEVLGTAERVLAHGLRFLTEALPKADSDANLQDPPEPFSQDVVRCPSCGHGIDPHKGWGAPCGVGDENRNPCSCMWTPNDIAAILLNAQPNTVSAEEPPAERPWWTAATRWYHMWASDYPDRAEKPMAAILELLSTIALDERQIPLAEVASRLVLVAAGPEWTGYGDRLDTYLWARREFIANNPLGALVGALASNLTGPDSATYRRVNYVAKEWLDLIERGTL